MGQFDVVLPKVEKKKIKFCLLEILALNFEEVVST